MAGAFHGLFTRWINSIWHARLILIALYSKWLLRYQRIAEHLIVVCDVKQCEVWHNVRQVVSVNQDLMKLFIDRFCVSNKDDMFCGGILNGDKNLQRCITWLVRPPNQDMVNKDTFYSCSHTLPASNWLSNKQIQTNWPLAGKSGFINCTVQLGWVKDPWHLVSCHSCWCYNKCLKSGKDYVVTNACLYVSFLCCRFVIEITLEAFLE